MEIILSTAIEREFGTQSMSYVPFYSPAAKLCRSLHPLLLINSSASKEQGSGILVSKGEEEDYGDWGKTCNSKPKILCPLG